MANLIAITAARDHALGEKARTHGLQANGARSSSTHPTKSTPASSLHPRPRHAVPPPHPHRRALPHPARSPGRRHHRRSRCQRQHQLWLHIDGTYGALSALSSRFQPQLSALALDPHKSLFCAYEAGCVLVRDRRHLHHSFNAHPSYLTMSEDPDFIDFANQGPQLSRAFKGLKVWWSLKHFGAAAYAGVIERMHDLALYMGRQIEACEELELLAPVVFNCVCFRVRGEDDDANRRAGFMNLRTTEADVDLVLDRLA